MTHSERMSPVDLAWLRMDRQNNLMVILGVMVLEGPVDVARLEKKLGERITAYRRFRQRAVVSAAGAFWVDDRDFDVHRHVRRVRLPGRGGEQALQRFVGELASEPLDHNHPLWQMSIIEKYEGGVAVVSRIHHCIADGIALMKVMLGLADDGHAGGAHLRHRDEHDEEGWLQKLAGPLRAAVDTGVELTGKTMREAISLAMHPERAAKLAVAGTGIARELAWLLLMPSDSATRFKGKAKGHKRVAWTKPLRLPDVKAVGAALDCSINDILLSCVAGSMRDYLVAKGDRTDGVEVRALVPINLRPAGEGEELGNRFGILAVELPVGIAHPLERLYEVRRRMLALKNSYEPPVTFGLFGAVGYAPKIVQDQLFDLLMTRASAVMTNVPGPSEAISISGSRVKQVMFWVPQSGDIGMGVSILSYAGKVQFGLITDVALTPDPEAVIGGFEREFDNYLYHVLLEASAAEEYAEESAAVEADETPALAMRKRAKRLKV